MRERGGEGMEAFGIFCPWLVRGVNPRFEKYVLKYYFFPLRKFYDLFEKKKQPINQLLIADCYILIRFIIYLKLYI